MSPPSELGLPQPPSRKPVCPPLPPDQKVEEEEAHSPAARVPIPTTGEKA